MHVLLIEDHPLYSKALGEELRQFFPEMELEGAQSIAEVFTLLETRPAFDLILLDLTLPDGGGLRSLLAIHQLAGDIPIVVISANENKNTIEAALKSGARGYIPKSANSNVIKSALTLVMSGETYIPSILFENNTLYSSERMQTDPGLTDRQYEVLQFMARGCSNKEIGSNLAIAETTVRVHATEVLRKLQVHNRTEAVLRAQELGLID